MIGMTSFAQEGEPMRVNAPVTAEQRNEMQMKRLAVELNLDANQEKEMTAILKEGAVKREVMNKEMDAICFPSQNTILLIFAPIGLRFLNKPPMVSFISTTTKIFHLRQI